MGTHDLFIIMLLCIQLGFTPIVTSGESGYGISYEVLVDGIEYGTFWRDVANILDFHYDQVHDRGLLIFADNPIYEFYREDNVFQEADPNRWDFSRETKSIYRAESDSIIFVESYFHNNGFGVQEISLENFDLYLSPYYVGGSSSSTPLYFVKDMVYDSGTDQLLIIAVLNDLLQSVLYDFRTNSWSTIPLDVWAEENSYVIMSGNSIRNTAILYYNSLAESEEPKTTYLFNFITRRWLAVDTPAMPTGIVDFRLIFHNRINKFVLIGGYFYETNLKNRDIWVYDINMNEWIKVFSNVLMLNDYTDPLTYYDPTDDKIIAFTRKFWSVNNYSILSIDFTGSAEGYEIDLGMSTNTFIYGVIGPISLMILSTSIYVFRKRAVLFQG